MSRFVLVTIEPVQQIAAEPATLDLLTADLRASIAQRLELTVQADKLPSIFDWPLVADPRLPAGFVYLRPFPQPAGVEPALVKAIES
ncbi:hypothetical protein [Streptomyces sp. NPDC094468]|uniref:hypothetical protein n=1 Tax=Streptomyces sp. NPDC094468 TaxID=3366066 RepID=UPI0038150C76